MVPSPVLSRNVFSKQDSVNHDDELAEDLDTPELTLTFPIVDEVEDETDEDFYMTSPNFSLPVDINENGEGSVETGRRTDSKNFAGGFSGGSFDSARSSSRFADLHGLTRTTMTENTQSGGTYHILPGGDRVDVGNIDFSVRSGCVLVIKEVVETDLRNIGMRPRTSSRESSGKSYSAVAAILKAIIQDTNLMADNLLHLKSHLRVPNTPRQEWRRL